MYLRAKNRTRVCFLGLCDSLRCARVRVKDIYLCQGGVPEAGDDLVVDTIFIDSEGGSADAVGGEGRSEGRSLYASSKGGEPKSLFNYLEMM